MHFKTPRGEVAFEIPDEWWRFSEMDTFTSQGGRFYPYRALRGDQEIDAVTCARQLRSSADIVGSPPKRIVPF